jgi:hypothetical protein
MNTDQEGIKMTKSTVNKEEYDKLKLMYDDLQLKYEKLKTEKNDRGVLYTNRPKVR